MKSDPTVVDTRSITNAAGRILVRCRRISSVTWRVITTFVKINKAKNNPIDGLVRKENIGGLLRSFLAHH
jgi:hypothetical protein